MSGTLQNISVLSQGPFAAADPCVSVYHGQQHIAYRDQDGLVWDSWYDGAGGWHLQRINGVDGRTHGPVAVAGPFIGVFHDQQHYAYLDNTGNIWDAWYDGHGNWNLQPINSSSDLTAFIDVRLGVPLPEVAVWTDGSNSQQHFTYLTVDPFFYQDIFWSSGDPSIVPGVIDIPALWQRQRFVDTGVKPGSSPVVGVFGNQQHVVYLEDSTGTLVDHWYDGDSHWSMQMITGPSGKTSGPRAMQGTLPAIWVDHTGTQQHFTYVGADRAIYDAFWDGNDWQLQKLTLGGMTDGPAAWSNVSVCNYQPADADNTVHVAYRDQSGAIWTASYTNGKWLALQVKDLPLGAPSSTAALPLAAGNVTAWVDGSGDQLHFTFRAVTPQVSGGPSFPPSAVEARTAARPDRQPATGPTGPIPPATGVIWDFFYQP